MKKDIPVIDVKKYGGKQVAILDGKIKNEREEAYAFMQKTGVELGLKAI